VDLRDIFTNDQQEIPLHLLLDLAQALKIKANEKKIKLNSIRGKKLKFPYFF
jgi:hypothetical protein